MPEKKHLLIIDDESEITDLLKHFFETQNFSVETAFDGIQGLAYIKKRVPDLVITDLLLPGEHGIDVVKNIKNKYFIPVIIITGVYDKEEIDKVMNEYVVEGFFCKPMDLEALLERVNAVLGNEAAV
ncbi:MAG: response regulator [bacterium]|nr:response regulator [bacterium]